MLPPTHSPSKRPRRLTHLTPAKYFLPLAVLAATLGCGQAKPDRVAVYPASGTLTFKGQPTPGAFISLHPKTGPIENVPTPRASVDKTGAFKISTFEGDDGAPEGEYVVTVRWYKPIQSGPDTVAGPNVIPPKYTNPKLSDLTVRIAAGENALPPLKL